VARFLVMTSEFQVQATLSFFSFFFFKILA
jgi:hypothetical protein